MISTHETTNNFCWRWWFVYIEQIIISNISAYKHKHVFENIDLLYPYSVVNMIKQSWKPSWKQNLWLFTVCPLCSFNLYHVPVRLRTLARHQAGWACWCCPRLTRGVDDRYSVVSYCHLRYFPHCHRLASMVGGQYSVASGCYPHYYPWDADLFGSLHVLRLLLVDG